MQTLNEAERHLSSILNGPDGEAFRALPQIRVIRKCKCGAVLLPKNRDERCVSCEKKYNYQKWLAKHKKPCPICGVEISLYAGFCRKCRKRQNYQLLYKSRAKQPKNGKMGRCAACKLSFELEAWQHPKLHWCPACRKRDPDYKQHDPDYHISAKFRKMTR